jgi:Mn-dependent DtxR family transcriptional regulator
MKDKPFVTFSEIAEYLSVNRSAVQKQVEGFRKKGYVDRRDDGSWHVLALNSRIIGK